MKGLLFFLGIAFCDASFINEMPWEDYILIPVAALTLAIIGGIMSGLTVGLMAIDELGLRLKLEVGTELEKYHARRILPILADHHLLLVTLLLANAMALETMPLVLDQMVGGVSAVIVSVLLTLFIAEVIPQALCIGTHQIAIASAFSPFIRVVIIMLYPISYFIARLLDKVIGHQPSKQFTNEELKTFFAFQLNETEESDNLSEFQVNIIHRAIDLTVIRVKDIYVQLNQIFFVYNTMEITKETVKLILSKNLSRIPVKCPEGN